MKEICLKIVCILFCNSSFIQFHFYIASLFSSFLFLLIHMKFMKSISTNILIHMKSYIPPQTNNRFSIKYLFVLVSAFTLVGLNRLLPEQVICCSLKKILWDLIEGTVPSPTRNLLLNSSQGLIRHKNDPNYLLGSIYGLNRSVWKHFVLDSNIWNHITVCKQMIINEQNYINVK